MKGKRATPDSIMSIEDIKKKRGRPAKAKADEQEPKENFQREASTSTDDPEPTLPGMEQPKDVKLENMARKYKKKAREYSELGKEVAGDKLVIIDYMETAGIPIYRKGDLIIKIEKKPTLTIEDGE